MLDTNAFNRVLDQRLCIPKHGQFSLLATRVQIGELNSTGDEKRRGDLISTFKEVAPTVALTASLAFGIEGAGWDQACWNDCTGTYERMLERLKQLDANKKKRPGKDGLAPDRDILIAETAIKTGSILVSDDENLRQVVSEFGGRALDCSEFEQEITR
jgi:predicted nucleic acid-binding protein